jgi:predicted RNA methylase
MLALKKGETLYELGCGDGTVLIEASKRGIKSVGYELNPIIYVVAKLRCFRYRKDITIKFGNYWSVDLRRADGVYVFLLDRFMTKLDQKLSKELKPGTSLVSYSFKIPGKKIINEKSGLYLYTY